MQSSMSATPEELMNVTSAASIASTTTR